MASTGTAFFPSASSFPNTTQYPGQGTQPIYRARYSTDDVSVAIPTWNELGPTQLRSWSLSRGRESELSEYDAGTATLTLDNRNRTFDPNSNAAIRPMNRWWLYEEFSGEVHDLFVGYANGYPNQWPGGGWSDAEAVVSLTDEFKVLSLGALPTTDPPLDTYPDVVKFDAPFGYWRLNGIVATTETASSPAEIGPDLVLSAPGSMGTLTSSPIIGDPQPRHTRLFTTSTLGVNVDPKTTLDLAGIGAFAIELWLLVPTAFPAGNDFVLIGPQAGGAGNFQYSLILNSTGSLTFGARNDAGGGTNVNVTGGALALNTWYHIVGTVTDANTMRLYVNGTQVNSTAWSNQILTADASPTFLIGDPISEQNYDWAEVAVYRTGMTASRVQAHYSAGTQRGFAQNGVGQRIGAVLDAIGSRTSRRLGTGVRNVTPSYMKGRAPVDVIREAVSADNVDAAFFTTAGGALAFLAADHRSSSPYNSVQAIFGDAGGTEIAYLDATIDYSESFLFNEWNVTRDGGTLQSSSDVTSISRYSKRSQSLTGLPLTNDTDAATVSSAELAKYKDPMQRVIGLSFDTIDPSVAEAVFRRDLMDKITVKRTPPGGGSRISQDLYLQKIEMAGANDGKPASIRWGVSPL